MAVVDWDEQPSGVGGTLSLHEPRVEIKPKKGIVEQVKDLGTVAVDNFIGRAIVGQVESSKRAAAAAKAGDTETMTDELLGPPVIVRDAQRALSNWRNPNNDYNPYEGDNLKGYEAHYSRFTASSGPEDDARIKREIDRQVEVNKILEDASWFGLKGAHMLGQIIGDPITYVPFAGIYGKAGSLAVRAARGATFTAGAGAASNVLEQVTRGGEFDLEEFVGATAISAVVGTVLGPMVGKALPANELRTVERSMATHVRSALASTATAPDDVLSRSLNRFDLPQGAADGAGLVEGRTLRPLPEPLAGITDDSSVLVGAYGLEKLGKKYGPIPLIRLANSMSATARRWIDDFANNNLYRAGNAEGVASRQAADIERSMWMAKVKTQYIDPIEELAGKYAKSLADDGERVNFQQMRKWFMEETAKAARRGGVHVVPEIQKAAKIAREGFDFSGSRAAKAGVIRELVESGAAATDAEALAYVTRRWDPKKIQANRSEFVQRLANSFRRETPELTEADALARAERTATKLSNPEYVDDSIGSAKQSSSLKERILTIDETEFEDFLDNDISELLSRNAFQLSRETAWVERFGSRDMSKIKAQVNADYQELIAKASGPKEQQVLMKQLEGDLKDMEALKNRYFGAHARYLGEGWRTASQAVLMYQTTRLLGGVLLSSLADVARPIYFYGVQRYGSSFGTIAADFKKFNATRKAMRKFGVAAEAATNNRVAQLSELLQENINGNRVNKSLQWMVDKFGKATFITQWTTMMKDMTGILAQDFILENSDKWIKGTITKKDIQKLAMLGIDENMARRIVRESQEHAWDHDGVFLTTLDEWVDQEAAETVQRAILKSVDTTINTPNLATKPLMTGLDDSITKMVLQFKSFSFASHVQTLIPALQQNDGAAYSGMLATLGLGAVVVYAKAAASGQKPPEDLKGLIYQATEASGLVALPMLMMQTMDKALGTGVAADLTGGTGTYKKFQETNWMGLLGGPTAGQAVDAVTSAGRVINTITGDGQGITMKDVRNARSFIPFQNVFYIRGLFERAEYVAADALGLKIPKWIEERENERLLLKVN